MFKLIRVIVLLAVIGEAAVAQDACRVQGLDNATDRDGVLILSGAISYGLQSVGVLFLKPMSHPQSSPPVLFAYSEVVIPSGRTDLYPMALRLAKDGGTVLLLERPVLWKGSDDPANRNPRLLDCASAWLLSQNNVDLVHITYVGPRLQSGDEKLRTPLAIANLKLPRRGGLRVPIAEAKTGSDTMGFTDAETRERLMKAIEQHWLLRVLESEQLPLTAK